MSENSIEKLFILGIREHFRFRSPKGDLTIEDIFDPRSTSLDELNKIAISLHEEVEKVGVKSFIKQKKTASTATLENKLEIVKYIIGVREDEAEKAKEKKLLAEQRQFLVGLREKKKMEQLEGLSLEDIEKQLEGLG